MAEETAILNLEVDQGAAEKQLERIEGVLLDNKKAVQELTKAYKDGNVTQEEYVKENLRLQQNIKKEQELKKTLIKVIDAEKNSITALTETNKQLKRERNNIDLTTESGVRKLNALNKAIDANDKQIQKNVSLLEKQKINIGNYASALDVVIPGTGAFVNQSISLATALGQTGKAIQATGLSLQTLNTIPVVAVVTGMVAAFNLLSSALKDTSENTTEATIKIDLFNQSLKESEALSRALTRIISEEDQEREKAFDKSLDQADAIADRYRRLADLTNQAAEEETKNARTRLGLLAESLKAYETEREIRLKAIEDYQKAVVLLDESGNVIDSLLTKEETRALQDRINVIVDSYNSAVKSIKEQIALLNQDISQQGAPKNTLPDIAPEIELRSTGEELDDPVIAASNARIDQYLAETHVVQESEEKKRAAALKTQQLREQVDQAQFNAAQSIFNSLSQLAEDGSAEQKALALVSIAINTAKAIAGAVAASQDIAYPGNLAAMYTSIAAVVAEITAATQIISGFEEGGYTGDGPKHQVAGVVHAGEYVSPKHIVNSPAAQPHIAALESMRTRGYADGGFVANKSTAPINQSLIIANALKQIPRPIVDVREVTSAQRRVEVRESVATL